MQNISLILPLRNEAVNLQSLLLWASGVFSQKKLFRRNRTIGYEIIIVTNNPQHPVIDEIHRLNNAFPIRVFFEKNVRSAAALFLKGVAHAYYPLVAKLPPVIAYSPDAMIRAANRVENGTDIVIISSSGQQKYLQQFQKMTTPMIRALEKASLPLIYLSTRYVWETIRAGLKSSKKFNYQFIHRALQAGFIAENFYYTPAKTQKKNFVQKMKKNLFETMQALPGKIKTVDPLYLPPTIDETMLNAGVGYKEQKYITHTKLTPQLSALQPFMTEQTIFVMLLIGIITVGLVINPLFVITAMVAIISVIYLIDIIFTFYLFLRTLRTRYEITSTDKELDALDESTLPVYSILCPLYKEAHMIPNFLAGIEKFDYPKNKLDVLLLLEEDDRESINAIAKMDLPSYIRIIVVPDSLPKTKPKACNFGLAYALGEYIVIYDAEDLPDPKQLKKAYLGFQKTDKKTLCLQAKLHYYNSSQNLLTRFFTAEYALWFNITLPGLQSLHTTIPLGGTSNHFRTHDLKTLLAWDPFNVTEDADLGIRLFRLGYQTAIIDSTTLEEANSNVKNWIRQRSRWIKGYMQTYLVHNRDTFNFFKEKGIHAFIFQLVIGGRIAFIFINPLLWTATLSYFIFHSLVGPMIDSVYPTTILYIAMLSLIFGNYLYLFCYIMGCVKRGQWSLIKYVYLIPFYWLLMSIAGYVGFYQLLFRPHYWEKTLHGLDLKKALDSEEELTDKTPFSYPEQIIFSKNG